MRNVLPEHVTTSCSPACPDSSEEAVIQAPLTPLSLGIEGAEAVLPDHPKHTWAPFLATIPGQVGCSEQIKYGLIMNHFGNQNPGLTIAKGKLCELCSAKTECEQKLQP